MLAIMSVATRARRLTSTLVFDEVDAGIGGHTARAVGARLRELGGERAGAVHHPSAADRLARQTVTSRSSRTPPPTPRAPRSCSSASPRSSRSWCACSAPTEADRGRAPSRSRPASRGLSLLQGVRSRPRALLSRSDGRDTNQQARSSAEPAGVCPPGRAPRPDGRGAPAPAAPPALRAGRHGPRRRAPSAARCGRAGGRSCWSNIWPAATSR